MAELGCGERALPMTTRTDAVGIQMDGTTAAVKLHRIETITVLVSRVPTVLQGQITATVMMDGHAAVAQISTTITTALEGDVQIPLQVQTTAPTAAAAADLIMNQNQIAAAME